MPINKKKFIFLVQGEGRGHMTQAISLYQTLIKNNHEVSHIFIGKSKRRQIPDYFFDNISSPITEVDSPNFITDDNNKSIRLLASIFYNARYLRKYYNSIRSIHEVVRKEAPDALINFYDFLGSFYMLRFNPRLKYFCIGHTYLTDHPEFEFAKGAPLHKLLFCTNNWLTSLKAYKKLALSFMEYDSQKTGKTVVLPPLLRKDLPSLRPVKENFLLCYMVNPGYSKEIMDWHVANREIVLHCFWDQKGEPEVKEIHQNLTFHQLNETKFMDMMRRCRGLATTAGFESICEAMYLDKPVLMVPVQGQYEQACNAIDATKAGSGIFDNSFNISRFINYIPNHKSIKNIFHEWYNAGTDSVLKELTDF